MDGTIAPRLPGGRAARHRAAEADGGLRQLLAVRGRAAARVLRQDRGAAAALERRRDHQRRTSSPTPTARRTASASTSSAASSTATTSRRALEETFFRIILFKFFNKIETWELMEEAVGALTWEGFDFRKLDGLLTQGDGGGPAHLLGGLHHAVGRRDGPRAQAQQPPGAAASG